MGSRTKTANPIITKSKYKEVGLSRIFRKEGVIMEYYEIRFKGHEITVYDTQDLIREICNIVHGYGIPESEIEVITHKGRGCEE